MKKMLHRFTTLLLVLSMLFTLYVPASAASTNEAMSYDTVASLNSSFGTVYYIEHPNERLTRTVWDVLDVVMAGASWAEFFGEPSFANLGWAVLDTVALAPVIPSSAYVRQAGKNLLDPDLLKAAMKSTPGLKEKILKGLRGATKAEKAKVVNELSKFVSKKYVVGKYTFLLDKSTMKHILERHHPAYWNGTIKAKQISVYKGYKRDKIEMRGDRAEMSDFPLYLNTVAGGLDRRDQRVNPKFCVNSICGANRAKFIQGGSRGIRLPPCQQHNAGGVGCQGRRSCSACP